MRLLPGSIAGRISLMLAAGMILLLAAATALSLSGLFEDEPRPRGPAVAGRMAAAVRVIGRLPAELRPAAAEAFESPELRVHWSREGEAGSPLSPDPFAERVERRLRHAGRLAAAERVVVGRPANEPDLTLARVFLADGSRLELRAELDWPGPAKLLRILVPLLFVGAGLISLAVLVARWITAPLGHFAAAAARLGANVDTPPLAENGPEEIRRAAQAFNRMQQRIRRFVDERLHVLAAASHDLRTPITRLRLRAEFIEDEEQLTKMLKDLDEMEAILSSTIAYVREETASEPSEPVALHELLEEICADLRHAGREATFAASVPVVVEGRPVALKRAFSNLAANATLYGGRADIRLEGGKKGAVVTIEDEGPGIPEQEQEKVFAPFYRLERSRNRQTGGTGLGLSVARTVIRAHAGEIVLANRPEGGLRQTVTLPSPEAG